MPWPFQCALHGICECVLAKEKIFQTRSRILGRGRLEWILSPDMSLHKAVDVTVVQRSESRLEEPLKAGNVSSVSGI